MSLSFYLRRQLKPNLQSSNLHAPTFQPRCAGPYLRLRQQQQHLYGYSTISHEDALAETPSIPEHPSAPPSADPSLPRFVPSGSALSAYADSSMSLATLPILDIPPPTDPLLAYIANRLMRDGKRHAAMRRVSQVLLHLYALTRCPPLPLLRKAVELAAPSIRVISHKAGGKVLQKPVPLSEKRRIFYAVTWILKADGGRKKHMEEINKRMVKVIKKGTVEERMARTIIALLNADPNKPGDNSILKKKAEMHQAGMVNRSNVAARATRR